MAHPGHKPAGRSKRSERVVQLDGPLQHGRNVESEGCAISQQENRGQPLTRGNSARWMPARRVEERFHHESGSDCQRVRSGDPLCSVAPSAGQ